LHAREIAAVHEALVAGWRSLRDGALPRPALPLRDDGAACLRRPR